MDAIKLLKSQHDEVEGLFKEFQKADSVADKQKTFEAIADRIAAHASIEEDTFYPAAYRSGEETLDEMLREAVEEHLAVKRVIADLLDMSPADEQFEAKMKVLKDLFDHHIEEEENELFPRARKEIEKQDLETMGADMEDEFEALLSEEPRFDLPAETEEASPLP